jgi:serine/threonine protein kinase
MPLTIGARLGPFEIVSPLGSGGMGDVYKAHDTRLGRDVAIKVLPAAFAADEDRRVRFEREAQAVAALSHPNVLTLFDTGRHEDQLFVVTELLEGETLRERLRAGAMPVRKAIEVGVQIARGLAAAHDKGLVHRDLKPENVFLLQDGLVKILDFGLARHTLAAGGSAATTTIAVTDPGTVMGTVGYMAPEQVRGQATDARSDLFSLGAVLYEILTGRRAFARDTTADTMTAILREEPPDLGSVRADLSPALDRIVRHCLEKNAAERFQSARDVAFALEALSGSNLSSMPVRVPPRTQRWLQPVLSALVVLAGVAGGYAVGRGTSGPTSPATVRFESKTFEPQAIFNARFAPDGQTIIFSAALDGNIPELFASRANTAAPQPLGRAATHLLSVSSKGELAVLTGAKFIAHRLFVGTLARMAVDGEPRAWLQGVREADWSPDGSTIAAVFFETGKDRLEYPLGTPIYNATGYLSDLRVSPDGDRVAFFEHPVPLDDRGWVKVVDRRGTVTTLTDEFWGLEGLAWTPDGTQVVFAGTASGTEGYQPYRVAASGGAPAQSLPSIGSVFVMDVARDGRWLVTRNDERMSIRARAPGAREEREFTWLNNAIRPHLSADGRALLFTDQSQSAGANYAVAYRRVDGGQPVRLGVGSAVDLSADGAWALAMVPSPPELVVYPVGPGNAIHLERGPIAQYRRAMFFPDGKRVLFCGHESSQPPRCYQQSLAGGPPQPVTATGRTLAYLAPDGRTLLTIGAEPRFQISTIDGGPPRPAAGLGNTDEPIRWASDGRSVFVQTTSAVPAQINRIDVFTGRRTFVRELAPPDRAGLVGVFGVDLLGDAASHAYTYWKRTSTLFVVHLDQR